jgi:preprotein translocase subunit YajC
MCARRPAVGHPSSADQELLVLEAFAQILPLILIVAVFWLLFVRPARRKQQAMARLRSSLGVGDTVMLGSGFYGEVQAIGEDGLRIEIAPGVVVRVHRDSVVSVESSASTPADSEG